MLITETILWNIFFCNLVILIRHFLVVLHGLQWQGQDVLQAQCLMSRVGCSTSDEILRYLLTCCSIVSPYSIVCRSLIKRHMRGHNNRVNI